MLTFKAIPKSFFFDRDHVIKKIGAVKVKALSKAGAHIRRFAQTSMRYRKKASASGKPPSAHKERGALLRKLLYFAYDGQSDSVVVGPVSARRSGVPALQEFGGVRVLRHARLVPVGGPGRDASGRFVDAKRVRMSAGTVLHYPPRPFMGPALVKEETKLPSQWANSVVGP